MNIKELIEYLKNKFNIEKLEFTTGRLNDKIKVTINGVIYEKTYSFGEPLESVEEFINNRI